MARPDREEGEGVPREQAADAPEVPVAELNQVEFVSTGKSIRVAPGRVVGAMRGQGNE